ncbi:hypothetical protein D3C71_1056690 [compost metagenome]
MKVTDALTIQSNSAEESGKTQFAIWQTLSRSEDTLLHLTNCVVNPLANNCGHLAGSSGGGSSGDTKALVSMMGSAMGMWASTQGNTYSTNDTLGYVNRELGAFRDQSTTIAREQLGLQKNIAENLSDIEGILRDSHAGGGEGTGSEMDYSKMPGAADNPLHVAGSNYESNLCQEGDNCAFDLGKINKQYDDKKTELKDKYGAIKDEVSQVFKFEFSGSASAPKCFDMFSLFGKSYSVCPEAEGYWETLAAIMMFIFYFIALMIVARR